MWLLLAVASAFFAGITSILAKLGLRDVDSTVATALRTIVVLAFAWILVIVAGAQDGIPDIEPRTWLFLVLSGLATGASWLCYFKALQMGDVNRVVPIDKSSTVMAMLMAVALFGERLSAFGIIGMALIAVGTMAMIERKDVDEVRDSRTGWLLFAVGSAVFAALTSILGKAGMEGVDSNLGTAIRTVVVLAMSWAMVAVTGKAGEVRRVGKKDAAFLVLSGLATGASWLCFFKALRDGPASVVVPVDKLSILVTVAFSLLFLKERMSSRAALGLAAMVAGTMMLLLRGVQNGYSAKKDGEVADSVPEFPYACAIQYRQVRGRTLLPGSGWDRVFPRRYGRLAGMSHSVILYERFLRALPLPTVSSTRPVHRGIGRARSGGRSRRRRRPRQNATPRMNATSAMAMAFFAQLWAL